MVYFIYCFWSFYGENKIIPSFISWYVKNSVHNSCTSDCSVFVDSQHSSTNRATNSTSWKIPLSLLGPKYTIVFLVYWPQRLTEKTVYFVKYLRNSVNLTVSSKRELNQFSCTKKTSVFKLNKVVLVTVNIV